MDHLADLYRRRAELAYEIEHGYPHKLPEYEAIQLEIDTIGREYAARHPLANLRRHVALAYDRMGDNGYAGLGRA
jgi:hypothetical protein